MAMADSRRHSMQDTSICKYLVAIISIVCTIPGMHESFVYAVLASHTQKTMVRIDTAMHEILREQ